MSILSYPPPPPPPPPKSSRKILLIAIIVAVVFVALLGFYFLQKGTNNPNSNSQTNTSPNPSSNSPTPINTPTHNPQATSAQTASPHATSSQSSAQPTNTQATSTPSSSTGAITNFRVGAHASYILTSYGDSTTTQIPIDLSVDQGTYNSTSCWLLIQTTTLNQSTMTTQTVFTYYYSKTTLQPIHYRIQTYINGTIVSDQQEDPTSSPTSTSGLQEVNSNTIVSYETVTVAAGTFTNCAKAQTTSDSGTTNVWINSSVPIWGIVKAETTSTDGTSTSSMELQSYGG